MTLRHISRYIAMLAVCCGMAAALTSCSDDDRAQPPALIPGGFDAVGDGSWENPLQVWQVNLGTTVDGRESNWVCGYIVGSVNRDYPSYSEASSDFGVPTANYNTIILAQIPYDEEEWSRRGYTWEDCVPVQLPSGTVRKALQLDANPHNFNRMVSIRGITGNKYLGAYALKSAADFKWGEKGKYEPPASPIADCYFCDFSASLDINYYVERGWSNLMQRGGLDGWQVGTTDGTSYASISSYYGSEFSGPYINWLITPAFDADELREKTLSFRTRSAYANPGSLEVYVLTAQNPQGCEPRMLECVIASPGESGFGSWAESGVISLAPFHGRIYIGFRYVSARGGSGQQVEYNLTDVNIGGADPADWEVVDPASIGTFTLSSEVSAGSRYAMVYDSKVFEPLLESYSYGYLGVHPVDISGSSFRASKDYAFTFIRQDDGSYVIKDCYDRYLYLQSGYSSFQVSYAKPEAGYLWSVEKMADGSWKITNLERDLSIEYSDRYGNVATVDASRYSGKGPQLYQLRDEAAPESKQQ